MKEKNKIIEAVQKSLIPEHETVRRSSRSARTTKSASPTPAGIPNPGPIRATEVSSFSGVARTSGRPPTSLPHPASSGDAGVATAPQRPSTNEDSLPEVAPHIPPIKWIFDGVLVDDPPPEAHSEGAVEMVTNIIKQGIQQGRPWNKTRRDVKRSRRDSLRCVVSKFYAKSTNTLPSKTGHVLGACLFCVARGTACVVRMKEHCDHLVVQELPVKVRATENTSQLLCAL